MKRNLTFITDAGHGWLSVSHKDLISLNIVDQISHCSYISPTRAYLEEDLDASIFLNAAKAAGWTIETRSTYSDHWKGREWPSYNPYFILNRFQSGLRVAINGKHNATVKENGKSYLLETDLGQTYRMYKTNPLIGLSQPTGE